VRNQQRHPRKSIQKAGEKPGVCYPGSGENIPKSGNN
jgi:hypothetical protein